MMERREAVGCARAGNMILLFLVSTMALATARPSYIAVPADQIAFIDLSSLHLRRVPRQTLTPPPLQPILYNQYQHYPQQVQIASVNPVQVISQASPDTGVAAQEAAPKYTPVKPPDFGEYVDFGAHTGNDGAFGWYADYPINQNEHESYRK